MSYRPGQPVLWFRPKSTSGRYADRIKVRAVYLRPTKTGTRVWVRAEGESDEHLVDRDWLEPVKETLSPTSPH